MWLWNSLRGSSIFQRGFQKNCLTIEMCALQKIGKKRVHSSKQLLVLSDLNPLFVRIGDNIEGGNTLIKRGLFWMDTIYNISHAGLI